MTVLAAASFAMATCLHSAWTDTHDHFGCVFFRNGHLPAQVHGQTLVIVSGTVSMPVFFTTQKVTAQHNVTSNTS